MFLRNNCIRIQNMNPYSLTKINDKLQSVKFHLFHEQINNISMISR